MNPDILEILEDEFDSETDADLVAESSAAVVLKGQNTRSRKALLNQELTIRYFPFRIGRARGGMTSFHDEPDLALEDPRPYRLSHQQVILERRGETIFVVDPKSRSGSWVNGRPLGGAIGGTAEFPLPPGKHDIRMGTDHSPFAFTFEVIAETGRTVAWNDIRFEDQPVPVSVLYQRLSRQTAAIFRLFSEGDGRSLATACDLVRSILANPGIVDPLYYFSAIPEPFFKDLIATHSLNVTLYAIKLALTIPLDGEDLVKFALAALFHDVGMYEVPRKIVHKRDLITLEEFEVIRRHPEDGERRLREVIAADELLRTVALEHHERIDGKGYPRGTKSLSRFAELIAMVDFFEALTHHRPQRGPVTPHEGMQHLIRLRHGIFSPATVKLFIKGFSLFPVYSVVRLNTGEIGQVMATHPDWPLRPTVHVFFDRNGQVVSNGKEIDLVKEKFIYIVKDISDRIFVDHYFRI